MITGFTMTITPDELKQIVREAVLETMTEKNDKPAEMKFYTRHETCEILHISLSALDTYVKKDQSHVLVWEHELDSLRLILIRLWPKTEITNPMETMHQPVKSENIQKICQLQAKRGKMKNRTSLLSECSVFMLRSVADGFGQSSLLLFTPNHIHHKKLQTFSIQVKVSKPNQK